MRGLDLASVLGAPAGPPRGAGAAAGLSAFLASGGGAGPGAAPAGAPANGAAREAAPGSAEAPPVGDPDPAGGPFTKAYQAPYELSVGVRQVGPNELGRGGGILPEDKERSELRADATHAGEDLEAQRKKIAADRRRRFEEGEPVPEEERPHTIGQTAHRLMQSGDYGDGPPFPLEHPEPPPWRRKGAEEHEIVEKESETLGKGVSAELVRCFEGDLERPCTASPDCLKGAGLFGDGLSGDAQALTAGLGAAAASLRLRARGPARAWRPRARRFL